MFNHSFFCSDVISHPGLIDLSIHSFRKAFFFFQKSLFILKLYQHHYLRETMKPKNYTSQDVAEVFYILDFLKSRVFMPQHEICYIKKSGEFATKPQSYQEITHLFSYNSFICKMESQRRQVIFTKETVKQSSQQNQNSHPTLSKSRVYSPC